MKRLLFVITCLFLACSALALTPSGITVNGGQVDPTTLTQFLNAPTWPGPQVANGTITPNGGISPIGTAPLSPLRITNIPVGPVALASLGTSTADINGQLWITSIFIPCNKTITKIGFLQGATATTDNVLVALYDPNGKFLTSSALTGVVLSGASTFQEQSLLSTVTLTGPATYFIAVQGNGTTAGSIRTVSALYNQIYTTHVSGTFGTLPTSITLPTTFTADDAPIVYVF